MLTITKKMDFLNAVIQKEVFKIAMTNAENSLDEQFRQDVDVNLATEKAASMSRTKDLFIKEVTQIWDSVHRFM